MIDESRCLFIAIKFLADRVVGAHFIFLSSLQFLSVLCAFQISRNLPAIMQKYNLDELISLQELRSRVANEFRRHSRVDNEKVSL